MTAYHGGKQRLGKDIAQVIVEESLAISDEDGFSIKGYCEPFCGMLGVYRHVPSLFGKEGLTGLTYRAGDTNESVIKMWRAAQKGWKPPTREVTRDEFLRLKCNGKSSADKGYIGHQYGFMGRYFQPFNSRAGLSSRKASAQRVQTIASKLGDIELSPGGYKQWSRLNGYVIYCDPPYQRQAKYYTESGRPVEPFDHESFWNWCRKISEKNIVFVSEYKAPKDFQRIWSKKSGTCRGHAVERLYLVGS